MDFYRRALELKEQTIAHRRFFHEHAEAGENMPIAVAYVMQQLQACGLQPQKCGCGVMAQMGQGRPVLLLRADMDALPMSEESGETFACKDGKYAHACGHDLHAAMLLTAAKMLSENKSCLAGSVRFMFQTAEETLTGCKNMVDHGVLDDPPVDAALAFHVAAGNEEPGMFMYSSSGTMMSSANVFRIHIHGKGGHGAYPNLTVDPIRIAVQIYQAFESLIAREADPEKRCVLTVGRILAGNAPNIIPDAAIMEGSLRTDDPESQQKLWKRIKEIAEDIAALCGGSAKVVELAGVPALQCDQRVTEDMISFIKELPVPNLRFRPEMQASASEDFAIIAEQKPSAYIYLSAGFSDERGRYNAHHPCVRFHEDACIIGAAAMAHCAHRWLQKHEP